MRTAFRSTLVVTFAAFSIALTAASSSAAVSPTPVKVNPNTNAWFPAASVDHLAWEQYSSGQYSIVQQSRGGGSPSKVNASGTSGYNSSPVAGTETIIYQQAAASSDLYLYNFNSGNRSKLPSKVDSKNWEYYPVASTTYVAFMRLTSTSRTLLLFNRNTGKLTEIESIKPRCGSCLRPTWVGSTHLIYQKCSKSFVCKLLVWTKGGSTQTIPNPNGSPYTQYSGAMDEAIGDIYYFRSTTWCGLFVEIRRTNLSNLSSFTTIYDVPEGTDGNELSLAPDVLTPTDTDLLFSQYDCIANDSDIYQIESVNTL
jgi:hypothetical protein